ncbi:DUF6985 domain-containing protein [Pedobacter westerhofensis]|uniref:DUF6985 domain-containing protein n=1 Tax=Pedobacter westerhofensis TaxID=425512 RepID=UPI0037426674
MKDPKEIWNYVPYNKLYVTREPYEDHQLYLLLSCECDWEIEHGLQLVLLFTVSLLTSCKKNQNKTKADDPVCGAFILV